MLGSLFSRRWLIRADERLLRFWPSEDGSYIRWKSRPQVRPRKIRQQSEVLEFRAFEQRPGVRCRTPETWLFNRGATTTFIELGSPWETGYIESFKGKFRDELLNRGIFDTVLEAKVVIEEWRRQYNTVRPHSSLGYSPPSPEAFCPVQFANA